MVRVVQSPTYWVNEQEQGYQEHESQGTDEGETVGENRIGLVLFFVGKAKVRCFHSEGKNNQHKCGVAIQIGNYTILSCVKNASIDRHQQIVEETTDDAAKAINGSIFDK